MHFNFLFTFFTTALLHNSLNASVVIRGKWNPDRVVISAYVANPYTNEERVLAIDTMDKEGNFTLVFVINKPQIIILADEMVLVYPDDNLFVEFISERGVNKIKVASNNNNIRARYSIFPNLVNKKNWVTSFGLFQSYISSDTKTEKEILKYTNDVNDEYDSLKNKLQRIKNSLSNKDLNMISLEIESEYYSKLLSVNSFYLKDYHRYNQFIKKVEKSPYIETVPGIQDFFVTYFDKLVQEESTPVYAINKIESLDRVFNNIKDGLLIHYLKYNLLADNDSMKEENLTQVMVHIKAVHNRITAKRLVDIYYLNSQSKLSITQLSIRLINLDRKQLKLGHELSTIKTEKKTVVLKFWATWCIPCIEQMELLKTDYNTDSDSLFIFISVDSDYGKWKKYSEKRGYKFSHFFIAKNYLLTRKLFGIEHIPSQIIVYKPNLLSK